MLTHLKERGDTLIEVLIAFSIFSLVIVGAIAVMNQGSDLAERSLETTLVREEMNSQAETIRFLHDSYIATYKQGAVYDPTAPASPSKEWMHMESDIVAAGATSATDPTALGTTCPATYPTGSFIMDSRNGTYVAQSSGKLVTADTFAQLTYTTVSGNQVLGKAQGIWVEAIRSPNNTSDPAQAHLGYIDFHILACWNGLGQDVPMTLGTIVRLYEPR